MNIPLLRRIQKQIAKEPRQFYMGWWFHSGDDDIPNCGTAACIAGWAVALSMKKSPSKAERTLNFSGMATHLEAERFLGIDGNQGNRLFGLGFWPKRFQFEPEDEMTPKAAKKAIARIDAFIKSKGAE